MPPLQNSEEKRSAIDTIEHELYDPKAKIANAEIHQVKRERPLPLPTSWGDSPLIVPHEAEKGMSFGVKLFLASIIFLIAAIGFAGWKIMTLRNVVSAANIDMTADITPYVEGGESTPLILTLRNRNTAALESANVTLLYKQGNGSQDEQEKVQDKREIGTVSTNEYKKQDFTVALYGSEGETRELMVKLEYKVLGSSAVFSKIITTQVVLRAPPIAVTVTGPEKLSAGQTGVYSFTVTNNSATTSLPSVLQVILPNNFTSENYDPKPLTRSTVWKIPGLAKGESKVVEVTGSFVGKQGERGTIQAKVGSTSDRDGVIGVVYSSQITDVIIRASPLTFSMDLASAGKNSESLRYGDRAVITISYANASTQALEDVSITMSLSGEAAVYNSIDPTNGYYDSIKKTITWDKASIPDLAVLSPNSQGTLRVIIPIIQKGANAPTLRATVVGSASTKSANDVVATISKVYGVEGAAKLEARTQYRNSTLVNTGPIPPEPNVITTYTLNLKVVAQNSLSNSRVSFVLPAYVSWRGVTSDTEKIFYDSKSRTVTWNIGKMDPLKILESEIGLTIKPSQSQVGQTPALTSGIVLDADEDVSKVHVKITLSPLTTTLYDEAWPENPAIVKQR